MAPKIPCPSYGALPSPSDHIIIRSVSARPRPSLFTYRYFNAMGRSRAKGKPSAGGGGGGGGAAGGWGSAEHQERESHNVISLERRLAKRKKKKRRLDTDEDGNLNTYKRTALSHDTADKIDAGKLRLHITKTKRVVETERERLRAWDDVEERRRAAEEERKRREEAERAEAELAGGGGNPKKKRKGRAGPETWMLRGAARPAWEVYDFDTRYVDPHLKEHEEARAKASRVRNLLSLYRGRFGEMKNDDDDANGSSTTDYPPQPYCRNFLALLMQLGHLCVEAKKFKMAREAFLEVMELEGTGEDSVVVTTARSRLMRMYLEANRPESARRLWERLPHDNSAWLRYSAALIEYVSWRLLEEEGSSRSSAEDLLCMAIAASPFCAYNIAFRGTFERVMEYGDELEDEDPGSLQEAIEYTHSEQMGSWLGTEGAAEWIQGVVLRLLNGGRSAINSDVAEEARTQLQSWEALLARIEKDFEATEKDNKKEETGGTVDDDRSEEEDNDSEDYNPEEADLLMYTGMFRTAMDMLTDAGELLRVVEVTSNDSEEEEEEVPVESRGDDTKQQDAGDDSTSNSSDESAE